MKKGGEILVEQFHTSPQLQGLCLLSFGDCKGGKMFP